MIPRFILLIGRIVVLDNKLKVKKQLFAEKNKIIKLRKYIDKITKQKQELSKKLLKIKSEKTAKQPKIKTKVNEGTTVKIILPIVSEPIDTKIRI